MTLQVKLKNLFVVYSYRFVTKKWRTDKMSIVMQTTLKVELYIYRQKF